MFSRTLVLFFLIFLCCLNCICAQQLLSQNAQVTASTAVAGTKAFFLTDGNETPTGPQQFCQTSTVAYGWIQIVLPAEFKITRVTLHDGNFGDKGEYNTNLYITATKTASQFQDFKPDADDPVSFLQSNGFPAVRLNAITEDRSETTISENVQGNVVRIWDGDEGGIRLAEVKIYGVRPGAATNNVAGNTTTNTAQPPRNTGQSATGSSNSNGAQSTDIDQQITQAISRRDNAAITNLLRDNAGSFNQQHIDNAFINGQVDQGKRIVTATGIKPSVQAINKLMTAGKSAVVQDLLTNGIADGNTQMLNNALKNNQSSLVSYLSKRVKPNSETFVLLANDNNSDLFEELIDNDNRVPDNKAINVAIDKNNASIVNLGLNNGGSANEALTYAMNKDNIEMVKLIVTKKGVDAGKVFKYAVDKNDETLYASLLAVPNADAKIALDEAMKAKKYEMALIALDTKRTLPTKYLNTAVEIGNTELAKKIVQVGGDANAGMEAAIKKNNFELLEFFINNGASSTIPKYMKTAAVFSSLDIVKFLVESGANANSGIEEAALNAREDVVSYLLDKGADANLGISLGAFSGSLPVVKMLVEKGANPTKGVENAVAQNKAAVLNYLIENGAELTSPKLIPTAVTKNYTEVFKLLAEKGATIAGNNLLQTAAGNGNVEIAKILLDNKFNPNDGMMISIQKNKPEVLQLLLENGAEIKETYARDAVNNKAAATIPVLAAAGADFLKADGIGNTLLHVAVTNNDIPSVEELIKVGVPLDAQNVKGNTALHLAADMTDRVPIIMLLAKAGANLNVKNVKGDTPRDVAPGMSKTKKALKDLGAQ
jgi:ankyrin repeat protein